MELIGSNTYVSLKTPLNTKSIPKGSEYYQNDWLTKWWIEVGSNLKFENLE
jgi:hypothetical protein